jgi:PASTA domain
MPTIELSSIQVNAAFVAQTGKAEKALALALQFFDGGGNGWTPLNTALATEKGLLNQVVKLTTKAAAVARIKELAADGGLPPFRLVIAASLKAKPIQVVAEAPAMQYNSDTKQVQLQFGNNYALPADLSKAYLYDEAAATIKLYVGLPASPSAAQQEKLQKENQQLASNLATSNDKLETALAQVEAMKTEMAAVKKELTAKDKLIAKMEAEMGKVQKEASETVRLLNLSAAAMAEKEQTLRAAAVDMEQQALELLQLKEQITVLNGTIEQNVNTIRQLNEQVKNQSFQLESGNKIIEEQKREIAALEEKLTAMTQEAVEYKPMAQPVSKVYASILDEFKKTNELNKDGAYRLANISLNLKTFVEHDATGIRMQLVDANKLSSLPSAALSDFRVEIGEGSGSTPGSVRLPDLLGLTETAARKIIHSLGLSLKPVYQAKKDVPDGQSFKQSPTTGEVNPGDTITLVFSKHNL